MTVENLYYTLGNEFVIWSTCTLKEYADFMLYPLTLIGILIILYYPLVFFLFLLYIYNAILVVWKKIGNLPEDINSQEWDKPKQFLALAAEWHARILHSYEVSGLENLPKEPAILVYYHGPIPLDNYFLIHRIFRLTGKPFYSVVDHIVFRLPGLNMCRLFNYAVHPTREKSVNILKQGHQLMVAPGGLREQNYGNNRYKMIWGNRKGFAHIAIDAKVPIIPIFTQNIREGYVTYGNISNFNDTVAQAAIAKPLKNIIDVVQFGRPMRWLYERTRWLSFPLYGMFPVKLISHIGKPIPYDPDITPEKLAEKTQRAMEALRDKHQKIPGSILQAIRQRFETCNNDKQ